MASKTSVEKMRGMAPELAEKLKVKKIFTGEQLLKLGYDPASRKELAEFVGADPKMLLELLNRADLDRVKGIGAAYSNLLEDAGVDTVKELAKRVPEHLHAKLLELNMKEKITTHPPTLEMVKGWVDEAKTLPILLTY